MDHKEHDEAVPETERDEFVRLPGLFRRWELEHVVSPGIDFHLEEAGTASDGTPLFALYRREPRNHRNPNAPQEN